MPLEVINNRLQSNFPRGVDSYSEKHIIKKQFGWRNSLGAINLKGIQIKQSIEEEERRLAGSFHEGEGERWGNGHGKASLDFEGWAKRRKCSQG